MQQDATLKNKKDEEMLDNLTNDVRIIFEMEQIKKSLMLFLKTTVRNNVFCAQFYCAVLTTCFGPDRWPSSGNTYIKYTKATTVYVNGSVEIAA
jgi:hypothetical protein